MAFNRTNTAVVRHAPVNAETGASRAAPRDAGCPVSSLPEPGEQLLYRLAQSELTHLTSLLTALCRDAASGLGSDKMRLETLHHLSQRLDTAGTVLGELSDAVPLKEERAPESLLHLIRELLQALDGLATERRVVVSVDIAGAVRRLVRADFAPLLRLMLESAIRATSTGGRLDIVTRREGETAAISITFSAVRGQDGGLTDSVLDLAIVRNLANRRGGRLAVVHRHALGQQWVLRLPLHAGALEDNAAGNAASMPITRLSQLVLSPNEDDQIA